MNEEAKKEVMKKAVNGKLACAVARKLAEDLGIPYAEVGAAADALGIKIDHCQLGCF